MARKTRVLLLATGTAFATLVSFVPAALSTQVASATGSPPVAPAAIYDSTSTPLVSIPSLGFEATQASEAGNLVQFSSSPARLLTGVSVTMDSWGCQSGNWYDNPICSTTPGSTFSEPITFNLYNVGPSNAVGSLITTVTQTFNIPYRPSTDPSCPLSTADGSAPPGDMEEFMYNGVCSHGLPVNVTFNLGDVVVPDEAIWSVAYNTSDYGAAPYNPPNPPNPPTYPACHATSEGCGYDSLNVGLTVANGPSVGTDPLPGTVYWSTLTAANYCDGGTAGNSSFRLDSPNTTPCWGDQSPYHSAPWDIPAAQFNAVPEISVGSSNTASFIGHTVTFTVTGPPTATHSVTVLDGSHPIGSCALSDGSCAVSTRSLSGGNHSITASYGGDGNFPAFTSAAINQAILTVPSSPTGPTAVPGNGSATIHWSPPSNSGGTPVTSYSVTGNPSGACGTSGATSCSISGLTNGTPYRFSVTATNIVGTSFSSLTPLIVPATTGYHVYASPPVVENHKPVWISATGAQSGSPLTLTVAGHGSKHLFADPYGAGAVRFTIGQSGKYAISATNNGSVAHGVLYVAHVTSPSQASHNSQIPILVRNAIPGTVIQVVTSDDGTFSVPVPSNGRVVIDLPPAPTGSLRVTVLDAGYQLVKRTISIT
jgi:hypothetical protein